MDKKDLSKLSDEELLDEFANEVFDSGAASEYEKEIRAEILRRMKRQE